MYYFNYGIIFNVRINFLSMIGLLCLFWCFMFYCLIELELGLDLVEDFDEIVRKKEGKLDKFIKDKTYVEELYLFEIMIFVMKKKGRNNRWFL